MTLAEWTFMVFAGFLGGGWLLYWLVYKPVQERYHAVTEGEDSRSAGGGN